MKKRYHYKHRKPQRIHFRVKWLLWALLCLALLAYPFVEASQLTLDEHTMYVRHLPSNLKNLKIAYASDIHLSPWFSHARVEETFQKLNGLNCDIIILGGDYALDSDSCVEFFETMPPLHARLGVFGVLGNRDRTEPDSNLSLIVSEMKSHGVVPLVNNVSRIKVGQSYLYIAGSDDIANGFPDVASIASEVSADDFVIFAGHSPDLMADVREAKSADNDNHWFDLALFGQTHGGQINIFGHTPFSELRTESGPRYRSGWLEENRAEILISNGIGTTGLPVRLFAPPQIHLITLKNK